MLATPLFAPWRPVWDAVCPELTRRVDKVVEQRRRSAQSPPSLRDRNDTAALLYALELAKGKLTSAAFLQEKIVPLLIACVWPRWLLLESALDESARAGDLHLVSQILRGQIEELDALRAVANLVRCKDDSLLAEQALQNDIQTVRRRVLPRFNAKSDKELLAHAASNPADRPEKLVRAFGLMSEYVHPNYGSHMLAVRPHTPDAATAICETFLAIYEAFANLPWVQDQPVGRRPPPQSELASEVDPFTQLADTTIPYLRPWLPSAPEQAWRDAPDVFRRVALIADAASPLIDTTMPEAMAALNEAGVTPDRWPDPLRSAAAQDSYRTLVRLEKDLVEAARMLLPAAGSDTTADRVVLLLSALAFAITLTEYKLQSLSRRAATLLNHKNVLGAAIAVRSMIEHHAVAIVLGDKMDGLWERLEKGGAPEDSLMDAEKQVARVLAGSRQPAQHAAAWRMRWKETVEKPYNIMTSIQRVDEREPGLLEAYGLLSHIVHGTICTGGDLLGDGGTIAQQEPTLAQLVLFLGQLMTHSAMLDRQAGAMLLAQRLHLLKANGTDLERGVRDMALPAERKLKKGRDVRGEGTRESPFRFRHGLFYQEAFRRYLIQEEIKLIARQAISVAGGVVDCVEVAHGQAIYFSTDAFHG